jgi:hypothetical protein
MVRLLLIFKTGRLLNIDFFIDVAIEKYTFHIYLIELDVMGIIFFERPAGESPTYIFCFSLKKNKRISRWNIYTREEEKEGNVQGIQAC